MFRTFDFRISSLSTMTAGFVFMLVACSDGADPSRDDATSNIADAGPGNTTKESDSRDAGATPDGASPIVTCEDGTWDHDGNATTECVPWTTCPAGTYVKARGTAKEDRTCAPCDDGTTTSSTNQPKCVETRCPAGTKQTAPATATSPPACEDCVAGTYCAGDLAEPIACTSDEWDDDADSSTPCAERTSCIAGQWVRDSGSTVQDRACEPCANSTFSSTVDAPGCSPWTACSLGEYVKQAGTASTDQTCAPCADSTFTSTVDAPLCSPWSVCSPGTYVAASGTASSDRTCTACPTGTITTMENAATCRARVASLATGTVHQCALFDDGQVSCWGYNYSGQLGSPGPTNPTPIPVPGILGATSIAAFWTHVCVVMPDRTARCWGSNTAGQVGNGSVDAAVSSPTNVEGLSDVSEIATGRLHTCARLGNGTVQCWGDNAYGQLGDGTTTARLAPVTVAGLSGVVQIAVGDSFSCARLETGTVQCWGMNGSGQLGDGTTTDRATPVPVASLTDVADFGVGRAHGCARLASGNIACWGHNLYGQVGDGSGVSRATPVTLPTSAAKSLTVGNSTNCLTSTEGVVTCWGRNASYAFNETKASVLVPTAMTWSASNIVEIRLGQDFTCYRRDDDRIFCVGQNTFAQLGDGTTTTRKTFVPVNL